MPSGRMWLDLLNKSVKAKLLLEATFFIIIFTYLKYLDIQVQNGQWVLVPSILDIGLASWGSMAILDNDDEGRYFLK